MLYLLIIANACKAKLQKNTVGNFHFLEDTALFIKTSNQKLKKLLSSDENIDSFLKVNKDVFDYYVKSGYAVKGQVYLDNILSLKEYCLKDTGFGFRVYTKALYNKAYDLSRPDKYVPEVVVCYSDFLLCNSKMKVYENRFLPEALQALAIQYHILGDLHKAEIYYRKEIAIRRELTEEESIQAPLNNLVILFSETRQYDSAIVYANESLSLAKQEPRRTALSLIYLAEALNEKKRNSVPVLSFLLKANKLIGQLKDDDDVVIRKAEINKQFGDYFKDKDINRSIQYYKKAINNLCEIKVENRILSKLTIALGNDYLEKNIDSASIYFQKALSIILSVNSSNIFSLPVVSQIYPENTILEALDAKANAFQLLYQQKPDTQYLTTAIQCYTLSFEVEKKLMQYFSYDESKLLMLNESRQRSQKAINLCYQLYQLTKDNQWAQKAFEFAEKNKAFVLLESVKRNLASNSALQNDTLYQKVQSLQLQLAYTERSLAEASGDSAKQKIQQQKTKLENDLLFANTALGRQSIAYKTVMEKEDSISATMVSEGLLNENTGLVEFFNADSVTYAFVLNKKQSIQFIRYSANLAPAIDSLLYFFRSASAIGNQPLVYQKAAYDLYKILQFDQLDKGWQNLIIIPDGKISFLPFDALITNTSYTVNLQQASYFINQCNTLYGYSASILLKQLHNNQSVAGNTTVFAPVFSNSQNNQQPLQYSLQEAEAIAANRNTTSFIKEKATLANFKQQFTNSCILHIATHAYADTGTNSNPKIEFIDSSLLLNELYAMHTNASLVVLSACETGLGKLNSSEGPMSLARGFYYAGARNVITSYWNVDDKSTASLFGLVYKNIKSSGSANALDMAKKELINGDNGKFASPYYWAGFVHIGMPQKKENPNYWWWLLVPAAVVMGYGFLRRYTV